MTEPTISVREAVLRAVQNGAYEPLDLLVHLGKLGYTDSDAKQAISELIHEGEVELTSHRLLRLAA